MPDIPVCGWQYPDGTICREPRKDKRCEEHEKIHYRTCVGCAGEATRTCSDTCADPVCEECQHHPNGMHSSEGPGPFAQQMVANPVNRARREMVETVAEALKACAVRGQVSFPDEEGVDLVATLVLDALAIQTLMRMVEGLAKAQGAQAP